MMVPRMLLRSVERTPDRDALVNISEMARVAESRVTNAYKTLNEELGLPAEPVSPSMFVPRLASALKCPDDIRQRARTLAEQAEEHGVTTGVHPAGFAAACLYKAGQEQGDDAKRRRRDRERHANDCPDALLKFKEKAPPFKAGMNPTVDDTTHRR